jgi:hypothetical protein
MKFTKADLSRVVFLVIGLLARGIGGWWLWMQVRNLRFYEHQIQPIRQLALSDDPGLAEVLDRSVVGIAAGDFLIGSNHRREDEFPQRSVYLDEFEIDRFEVTNIQFQRYQQATGDNLPPYWPVNSYPPGQAYYPVVGVSRETANASEWVFDWYNWSDYSEMSTSNLIGQGPPWKHCLRGSSWFNSVGNQNWVQNASRCSARNSSLSSSDPRVGFCCARTP